MRLIAYAIATGGLTPGWDAGNRELKERTVSTPGSLISVARRARSISSAGMLLLRARLSSTTSIWSSCLRLVVRMIATSEVLCLPSMIDERSSDTITCSPRMVEA